MSGWYIAAAMLVIAGLWFGQDLILQIGLWMIGIPLILLASIIIICLIAVTIGMLAVIGKIFIK